MIINRKKNNNNKTVNESKDDSLHKRIKRVEVEVNQANVII